MIFCFQQNITKLFHNPELIPFIQHVFKATFQVNRAFFFLFGFHSISNQKITVASYPYLVEFGRPQNPFPWNSFWKTGEQGWPTCAIFYSSRNDIS